MNISLCILSWFLYIAGASAAGYKILGILPHPGKSHFDVFEPLLKALAVKGHEVTVISHFPQQQSLKSYRDVSLKGTAPPLVDAFNVDNYKGAWYEKYLGNFLLAYFGYKSCVTGLSSRQMQDFLRSNQTFDLIIMEYFNTDCYLGFAHKFNAPIISVGSCTLMPWLNERFANPDNPAYIPLNLLRHSDHMSFLERVDNTIGYVYSSIMSFLLMEIPSNILAKRYFGDDVPNLREIAYNTSLMLENVHFSLSFPRPQVPSIIDVGGIHIGTVKKLPELLARTIGNEDMNIYRPLDAELRTNKGTKTTFCNALNTKDYDVVNKNMYSIISCDYRESIHF